LHRGQQGRRRDFAGAHIGSNNRLCLGRILTNDRSGVGPAKCPAVFARFAAGAWGYVPFAPADPAVAIAHLYNDRLAFGKGAIREHMGPDQRRGNFPQSVFLYFHYFSETWRTLRRSVPLP